MTVFKVIGLAAVAIAVIVVGAGQLGLLAGSPPAQLGVTDGRLPAPSLNPNSVSSQASLYPGNPQQAYAAIAPLQFSGNGEAAMSRLAALLATSSDTVIVTRKSEIGRAHV